MKTSNILRYRHQRNIVRDCNNKRRKNGRIIICIRVIVLYGEDRLNRKICGKYTRRNQWKDRKIVFKWKSLPILFCLFLLSTSSSSYDSNFLTYTVTISHFWRNNNSKVYKNKNFLTWFNIFFPHTKERHTKLLPPPPPFSYKKLQEHK